MKVNMTKFKPGEEKPVNTADEVVTDAVSDNSPDVETGDISPGDTTDEIVPETAAEPEAVDNDTEQADYDEEPAYEDEVSEPVDEEPVYEDEVPEPVADVLEPTYDEASEPVAEVSEPVHEDESTKPVAEVSEPVHEDESPEPAAEVSGPAADETPAEDAPETEGKPDKKSAKAAKKAQKAAKKAAKKSGKAKVVLPWVILGSLVVSAATYGVAIHIQTKALSAYDRTMVYVANNTMVDGHVIEEGEAAAMTKFVELPSDTVPADAVTDVSVIVNSAARYDIAPGTILCSSMFETVDEMQAGLKEPVIAGFRSDDIYQVVGGVLRPGDTISIYTIDNTADIGSAVYEGTLRWSDIRVQDVFDSSGARIDSTDKLTPAARVNIYMDKSEIEDFYAKLAQGSLRVVVHCD